MSPAIEWSLDADAEPTRLDVAVAEHISWISRTGASDAIRSGVVKVNGEEVRRPSFQAKAGDLLTACLSAPRGPAATANPDVPVNVVYKDGHIAVVDKLSGISVHPGSGHQDDTLVNGMLARYPQMRTVGPNDRPGVVHRLDKDTSGLLVFGLTQEALDSLGRMMRARSVRRVYTALVHGHVRPDTGTVEAPIGRDPANRTRQAVVDSGKPARTRYRLVETIGGASLLEVRLDTGRMHQVRVHMAAIGFPVIGDPVYGKAPPVPGLSRQFLHASKLELAHPVTGEDVSFESPLPADLQAALDWMRDRR